MREPEPASDVSDLAALRGHPQHVDFAFGERVVVDHGEHGRVPVDRLRRSTRQACLDLPMGERNRAVKTLKASLTECSTPGGADPTSSTRTGRFETH